MKRRELAVAPLTWGAPAWPTPYDDETSPNGADFSAPLTVPLLRHLMWAVHEVTAADLRSVLVSAEAALHAEGDLVSEVRREFKGAAVHAAVPLTRARRVGTPGPSSWST
jgi:hypothetical protein